MSAERKSAGGSCQRGFRSREDVEAFLKLLKNPQDYVVVQLVENMFSTADENVIGYFLKELW